MTRTRTRQSHLAGLREVWRHRELLRSLTARNLRVKYKRSALGFLWTLLNPLLMLSILAVVFSTIVKIQVPHYLAFLLSGYFAWNFMLQTMSVGTYVLAEHANLNRSVAYPKEIPILAALASRMVEYLIELTLVLAALLPFHHHGLPPAVLLLPWLMAVQILLSLGFVFPIAVLSVFYHDVQHALPIVLTALFYISPVFYPASMVPGSVQKIYLMNPVAQLLTAYHTVLYDGRVPSIALICVLTGVSVLLCWSGYGIFNRYKHLIPEIL